MGIKVLKFISSNTNIGLVWFSSQRSNTNTSWYVHTSIPTQTAKTGPNPCRAVLWIFKEPSILVPVLWRKFKIRELLVSIISKTFEIWQFPRNFLQRTSNFFSGQFFDFFPQKIENGSYIPNLFLWIFGELMGKWVCTWPDNWRVSIFHFKNYPTLVQTFKGYFWNNVFLTQKLNE